MNFLLDINFSLNILNYNISKRALLIKNRI